MVETGDAVVVGCGDWKVLHLGHLWHQLLNVCSVGRKRFPTLEEVLSLLTMTSDQTVALC